MQFVDDGLLLVPAGGQWRQWEHWGISIAISFWFIWG